MTRPHIVVVGGGFAGMNVVSSLASADADVTLIDRRNHHLFQPLLYEVATAALSPGQIAMPLRQLFSRQKNATVVLGKVDQVNLEEQRVFVADKAIDYDYLVLATGATHHYFGNDSWAKHAPGLKTVDDALSIRRRFLLAFEKADRCSSEEERKRFMTTVIVGGGPTGIELAGTMSEVARRVLVGEFRNLDTSLFRIVLAEGSDRLLSAMPPELSERTQSDLEKLGVSVRLNTMVTEVDDQGVEFESGERIDAANVIWAAGVRGAPPQKGVDDFQKESGRIEVEPDLSLPGRPNVFAIGDLAYVESEDGEVPGLAPAALQMGRHVGKLLKAEVKAGGDGAKRKAFRYRDKGTLATIGRGKAVAEIGRFKFGGLVAWLLWVFIHIFFLVGFRNRIMVLIEWAYAYVSFRRGARLITGDGAEVAELEPDDPEVEDRSPGARSHGEGAKRPRTTPLRLVRAAESRGSVKGLAEELAEPETCARVSQDAARRDDLVAAKLLADS